MTAVERFAPFGLCEVCDIELAEDRQGLETCSRGCRGVLRRLRHAAKVGDPEKLHRARLAQQAICEEPEKAAALTAQTERLIDSVRT